MLEKLEHMMVEVSRDVELSAIVRIAALVALEVIGKYYALTDDNEVYRIAISMSFTPFYDSMLITGCTSNVPRQKLEWFIKNADWHEADKIEARRVATQRWLETYAPTAEILSTQSSSRLPAVCTAMFLFSFRISVNTICRENAQNMTSMALMTSLCTICPHWTHSNLISILRVSPGLKLSVSVEF